MKPDSSKQAAGRLKADPGGQALARDIMEKVAGSGFAGALGEITLSPLPPGIYCPPVGLPLLAATIYLLTGGPLVVAAPGDTGRLAADIEFFLPGKCFHLPGQVHLKGWSWSDMELAGRSLEAGQALYSGDIVVAGVEALLGGPPPRMPECWPVTIREGTEIDLQALMQLLVEGGYQREYSVEGWSRFAVRGGIMDIFPSTAERPVRLEMCGDRVESLREFNVVSQRSLATLEQVQVYPSRIPGNTPGTVPEGTRVLAVDAAGIEENARGFCRSEDLERTGSPLEGWGQVINVTTLPEDHSRNFHFPVESVTRFRGDLRAALTEWQKLATGGFEVMLLLEGRGQVRRARELWEESGGDWAEPRMEVGNLSGGFLLPRYKLALFTSSDILGKSDRRRTTRRSSSGTPVSGHAELEVGGYVVHVDQGIGIYRGLVSRQVQGVTREYLLLEYAREDRLYVPTTQLGRVQRYVGAENPAVNRLRGTEWSRARKKARQAAEEAAIDLFRLYVDRNARPGFAFSADTPWQRELEDSFIYEETPDQLKAVQDVKLDMESSCAMDRLVCGDVGYGKTEVAIRASMKAVMDSRQVAVLVPTTVLARQHYETFSRRLAPFPIKVEMLSRFLPDSGQKRVTAGISSGEVDVVIGTHRLLQDDVAFRNLGLLVVDEEQKFGVVHKEKLRRISREVDTLVLSATPIPRTLQMSLSGIREISIIDTPPEDRHPVATYVGELDRELVRRAVEYEIARGGQVFYLHNRIKGIVGAAQQLQHAFPGVGVAVAHGRMPEDDLERVMLEFADGLHDILVCTTIIESGLDLPNVNTLIVDRADRLGLAQMYQVRGRVGRAIRRAYAYLFYPNRTLLTEQAAARLAAITEMTPLGSGMKIAMRDLEIRGAGNLLGKEQSGQIEAVGFEMYCQLLREAIDSLKGKPPPPKQAVVELPVEAYIPPDYVSDQEARVELYRRLAEASAGIDIDDLATELRDRFGPAPLEVEKLIRVEKIKLKAGGAGIEQVAFKGKEIQIRLFSEASSLMEEEGMFREMEARYGFCAVHLAREQPVISIEPGDTDEGSREEVLLGSLESIVDDIILCRGQAR